MVLTIKDFGIKIKKMGTVHGYLAMEIVIKGNGFMMKLMASEGTDLTMVTFFTVNG